VRYAAYGLFLFIGSTVVSGAVAIPSGTGFGVTLLIGAVGGLIGLIALILFFIGFYYLYAGRQEFGADQELWMGRALWAFIAAIILIIVVGALVGLFILLTLFSSGVPGNVGLYYVLLMVTGVIPQVAVALTIVLPIRSLLAKESMPHLGLVAVLIILGPVVTYGVAIAALAGGFTPDFGLTVPPIATAIGAFFSAVPLLLAGMLYLAAKGRIDRGEIKATPPRLAMYPTFYTPPYPYVQPYAPPYGYNPYPNQPPPYPMYAQPPPVYAPAPQYPPMAPPPVQPMAPQPMPPATPAPSEEKPAAVIPDRKKDEEKA